MFRNDQELTIKSISSSNIYNATAILTDGEQDYTVKLVGGSVYSSYYPISNAFNSGWLSYISSTNMTLEFEIDNLTKISYCAGLYSNANVISNNNTINITSILINIPQQTKMVTL